MIDVEPDRDQPSAHRTVPGRLKVPGFHATGSVVVDGEEGNSPSVNTATLRRQVGMLFQRPNVSPCRSPRTSCTAASRRPRRPGRRHGDRDRAGSAAAELFTRPRDPRTADFIAGTLG